VFAQTGGGSLQKVNVAVYVALEAKPGKEEAVAEFLRQGKAFAEAEPATTWFGVRLGPSTFAIFDAFPDDAGRQVHMSGKIAAALMEKAGGEGAATVASFFCVDESSIAYLGHSDGGAMAEGIPVYVPKAGDDAPPARLRILTRLPMAAVTSQDVPKDGVSPIAKPPCHTSAGLRLIPQCLISFRGGKAKSLYRVVSFASGARRKVLGRN
jgi:quinol monooxygenase YgiN